MISCASTRISIDLAAATSFNEGVVAPVSSPSQDSDYSQPCGLGDFTVVKSSETERSSGTNTMENAAALQSGGHQEHDLRLAANLTSANSGLSRRIDLKRRFSGAETVQEAKRQQASNPKLHIYRSPSADSSYAVATPPPFQGQTCSTA